MIQNILKWLFFEEGQILIGLILIFCGLFVWALGILLALKGAETL